MTTETRTDVQAPALPQRPLTFRERALAALETHQGADYAAYVSQMHEQDMAEAIGQTMSARAAVAEVAAAAAVDQQMLASVLSTVQPMLRRSAEHATRAGHLGGMIEALRSLLVEAETNGTAVDPERLRAVLSVRQSAPSYRPLVLGFVAASHFRLGHFRHVQTGNEWHLPFVGYSLCEEQPERPMTTHMSFLREGVVRPRPQLAAEFGLALERVE